MSIGSRIALCREQAGLQSNQLSFRLGYKTPSKLSNYETGARQPPIQEVKRIAEALSPQLGDHVLFYILTGEDYRKKLAGSHLITVADAARELKSLLSDAEEMSRIRIEPSLSVSDLVSEFIAGLQGETADNQRLAEHY